LNGTVVAVVKFQYFAAVLKRNRFTEAVETSSD